MPTVHELTNVLISSQQVGDCDNGVLYRSSMSINGITGVMLYDTISAEREREMKNKMMSVYQNTEATSLRETK